jgi:hypothetical protein
VYLRQVSDVEESFALRYGRVDAGYRQVESTPESASDQLPELRRTAHALTVLRARAEGLAVPGEARELRRSLIAYFREEELVAQELVEVTAFVGEIQQTKRSIGRAGETLRSRLGSAAGPQEKAAAVKRYAERLVAEAERLAQLEAPSLVSWARRPHVGSLRAHAAAVTQLVDSRELESIMDEVEATSSVFASEVTAQAQRQAMASYDTRRSRIRQLQEQVEQEQRNLERLN